MGQFGFSYVGLAYLLMLIVPNLLWTKRQPAGYDFHDESKALLLFERVGQVLVTCCALVFSDFNLHPFTPWSIWLIVSFALMFAYEAYWVRYFRSSRTLRDFYGSFLGVPCPGATLPVAAFFLLGVYGKVAWMMISVAIFGIGHIGIHWQHRKKVGADT